MCTFPFKISPNIPGSLSTFLLLCQSHPFIKYINPSLPHFVKGPLETHTPHLLCPPILTLPLPGMFLDQAVVTDLLRPMVGTRAGLPVPLACPRGDQRSFLQVPTSSTFGFNFIAYFILIKLIYFNQ